MAAETTLHLLRFTCIVFNVVEIVQGYCWIVLLDVYCASFFFSGLIDAYSVEGFSIVSSVFLYCSCVFYRCYLSY